jgi:hypothetical protein
MCSGIRYPHLATEDARHRRRLTPRRPLATPVAEGGFPHSEIPGSKPVRSSPGLIAAYHVLHRLLAPRHPPDALLSLHRSHYQKSIAMQLSALRQTFVRQADASAVASVARAQRTRHQVQPDPPCGRPSSDKLTPRLAPRSNACSIR